MGWYSSVGFVNLGSCTTTGMPTDFNCTTSLVSSSSADVTVRGNNILNYGDSRYLSFRTEGNIVVEPSSGNNFTSLLNFYANTSNLVPETIRLEARPW